MKEYVSWKWHDPWKKPTMQPSRTHIVKICNFDMWVTWCGENIENRIQTRVDIKRTGTPCKHCIKAEKIKPIMEVFIK